jgi:uncharacterized protein
MKFHVESWAPEYGSPAEANLADSTAEVDPAKEVAPERWAPISPPAGTPPPPCIVFVDGVRRVDARLWVDTATDGFRQGVAASYAAGAVRCDGRARIVDARVERGVFAPGEGVAAITTKHATWNPFPASSEASEHLWLAVQNRMADLEAKAAIAAGAGADAGLVVVDGPLRDRRHVPGVVGYVKTHSVHYLSPGLEETIAALRAGQRTPLFHVGGGFPRWSWYVRLPHAAGHPWAGVIRAEAPPDLDVATAADIADALTAVLPRFASEPHKDPRAPQNLHPIAGLERELRHRLGDSRLLERALRQAAARAA